MKVVDIPDVNEMTMREAALRYADHDIAVFPVVPDGTKAPMTKSGFYNATTDNASIPFFLSQASHLSSERKKA